MMLFFFTGLALLAAMTADADEAPCESFSYQVEMLKADIEATHCVTDKDLGEVCDNVARNAIVTCMEEDSVAARDDCMEDYFAAENIDDDGYVLTGQEVLDCCKYRKYSEFSKLFEEAHLTVCPAENAGGARRKRSTYYPQHYDQHYGLNTIWFQYHLCKDQGINCWFFTQGWNQGDFGSYYLYDNVLGDEDMFEDLDFATLLLLGNLGGGHGGSGSRYRRGADDEAGSGCDDCKVCIDDKCLDAALKAPNDERGPRAAAKVSQYKEATHCDVLAQRFLMVESLCEEGQCDVIEATKMHVTEEMCSKVAFGAIQLSDNNVVRKCKCRIYRQIKEETLSSMEELVCDFGPVHAASFGMRKDVAGNHGGASVVDKFHAGLGHIASGISTGFGLFGEGASKATGDYGGASIGGPDGGKYGSFGGGASMSGGKYGSFGGGASMSGGKYGSHGGGASMSGGKYGSASISGPDAGFVGGASMADGKYGSFGGDASTGTGKNGGYGVSKKVKSALTLGKVAVASLVLGKVVTASLLAIPVIPQVFETMAEGAAGMMGYY